MIKPTDIVRFDEMISPHELKTLRERISESDDFEKEEDWDEIDMDTYEEGKEKWWLDRLL